MPRKKDPRQAKYNIDLSGPDPLPSNLTEGQLRKYIYLQGTIPALDKQYGEGKWGRRELISYVIRKRVEKGQKQRRLAEKRLGGKLSGFLQDKTYDQRFADYQVSFEQITPNDEQSLRTLVTLEIQLQDCQQQLVKEPDIYKKQKIADVLATLSREHRQIQESLGIARAKRKTEVSAQDEVARLVTGARAFIDKLGVLIKCAHCSADFELGWLLYHFRDETAWRFEFECPHCHQTTVLSGAALPFEAQVAQAA